MSDDSVYYHVEAFQTGWFAGSLASVILLSVVVYLSPLRWSIPLSLISAAVTWILLYPLERGQDHGREVHDPAQSGGDDA